MPISLRRFEPPDADACQRLFLDTVHRVNGRDYTPQQLDAWAPPDIDSIAWAQRFAGRFAYVAVAGDRVVGFTDMTRKGHLDRLFVSAEHQRMGIARQLVEQLFADARQQAIRRITSDASLSGMTSQEEASYICDACGEEIVVPLDLSERTDQAYVEDCPVCCRANTIHVRIDADGDIRVRGQAGTGSRIATTGSLCVLWKASVSRHCCCHRSLLTASHHEWFCRPNVDRGATAVAAMPDLMFAIVPKACCSARAATDARPRTRIASSTSVTVSGALASLPLVRSAGYPERLLLIDHREHDLQAICTNAVRWQKNRVTSSGKVSTEGNTRVRPGKSGESFLGREKDVDVGHVAEAFMLASQALSDTASNTLALKVISFYESKHRLSR